MDSDSKSAPLTPHFFTAIAAVALERGPKRPLDYGVESHLAASIAVGQRVLVPVKHQMREGVVVALKPRSSVQGIRPIASILATDLISPPLFALAQWMSTYYCTSLSKTLATLVPPKVRDNGKEKTQLAVYPLVSLPTLRKAIKDKELTKESQCKVLKTLLDHPQGILLTRLLRITAVSKSPLTSLIKEKLIAVKPQVIERSPLASFDFFPTQPKQLNEDQARALSLIQRDLDRATFATHLLHGITGSGKTEVYMQAMAHARAQGKGVIFLVPEIALTSQTIERLKSRFTEAIAVIHSRLSQGERYDMWRAMREKKTSIVIGARSAIFSPIASLGLIIVDEEHDNSYKQSDEQPCYHARDIAIMRGKMENGTVLLGSATPSFESYAHAQSGKYTFSSLHKRATEAALPHVSFVDMKKEWAKKQGYQLLSEPLIQAIKKRFSLGEQTLLFLNKRGYQTLQLCTSCGETLMCRHCDVSLTFHKKENASCCHLCGFTLSPPPATCPSCHQTGYLNYQGVGTEKIERVLGALLPGIRILRMDADTTRFKGSHDKLFKQFRSGKADLLIGTQMIAKGFHFPNVTLVGILGSDSALHLPDFRAPEHLFQLLVQVAGRAGRSDLPGEVIIQTCLQRHAAFSLAAQGDYAAFFAHELEGRKLFAFPPFTRLAKLIFSGPEEEPTLSYATSFRTALLPLLDATFTLYPVIPCGHAKIKNRYRFKLIIKGPAIYHLSRALRHLQKTTPLPKAIRLLIDIDPTSTL